MTQAIVATIAGTGTAGCADEGTNAAQAPIAEPFGVTLGPDGALYFCDLGNHRICRVDLESGRLTTVAGSGVAGYAGDGGPALEAELREPYELRFNAAGDLYFVDMASHVVRCVEAETGHIRTIAGTGEAGFSSDGGDARAAMFRQPHSIEIATNGAIFVADIGNHRLRRIDPSGIVETFAGTGSTEPTPADAPVGNVPLHGPRTLAFDATGDLFLALREGNAVYRIDMARRTIHHIAGVGEFGYDGDGGDARAARLAGPKGIAVNRAAIYLADTESHTIRRIDRGSNGIATVVGNGERFDGRDGEPLRCGLARPHGVFATEDERVFIGDTDNHRVRVLLPDGR